MYSPLENFRTIDSAILDDKYKNIHIWKDFKIPNWKLRFFSVPSIQISKQY